MAEPPRFLVTTADQRTWRRDAATLFLGQWCRRYGDREIWGKMDAVVARPFCQPRQELSHALERVRAIESALWPRLVPILNDYHNVRYGERYWRILIGNWLKVFLNVLYNRHGTLHQCLAQYSISGTSTLASPGYHLAPLASGDFILASNDAAWNNVLFGRLLDLHGADAPSQEKIPLPPSPGFRPPPRPPQPAGPLVRLMQAVRRIAVRPTDVMIENTYLPRKHVLKLHLLLGQLPQIWRREQIAIEAAPNQAARDALSDRLAVPGEESVEKVISAFLFQLMPVSFLEGYDELRDHSLHAGFPSKPRAIFTSSNFDSDDTFKIWAAEQTERGAAYIIGQHGNVYGTHHQYAPSAEEEYADAFLSWGWANRKNIIPAFNLKIPVAEPAIYDPKGRVLLVELSPAHQTYIDDKVVRFEDYFSDQLRFVGNLTKAAKSHVIVRLSGGTATHHEGEPDRWAKAAPDIVLDAYEKTMAELVQSSRLVVHSYDSTGMLETLAKNVPTMAFWQEGLDHLLEPAVEDYQMLVDAGIVHLSAESAAAAVNAVFDDVKGWWESEKVQSARLRFISRYSRQVDDPAAALRSIILATTRSSGRGFVSGAKESVH